MGNTFATGAGRQIPPISEFQKIKSHLEIGMKNLKETSREDYDKLKVHFKKIFDHVGTSMNSKKNKTKMPTLPSSENGAQPKKSDMKKISEYLHHHLEEGIDAGKKGLEFTENEFKKYKEKLHSKLDKILLLKRNK